MLLHPFPPFEISRSEMWQDLPLCTLAWEQESSTWSRTRSGLSLDWFEAEAPGLWPLCTSSFLHHFGEETPCHLSVLPAERNEILEVLKKNDWYFPWLLSNCELTPHAHPLFAWYILNFLGAWNPALLKLCWNIPSLRLLVLRTASEGICSYALICSGALNVSDARQWLTLSQFNLPLQSIMSYRCCLKHVKLTKGKMHCLLIMAENHFFSLWQMQI